MELRAADLLDAPRTPGTRADDMTDRPKLTHLKAGPPVWNARDIPGWGEDGRLRAFYRYFLHPNIGIDLVEEKRALARDRAYAARLRTSLEHLLEQQPAGLDTWHAITHHDMHFYSEGELYGFLLDLHGYFFGTRPPDDPDPDRPAPPEHWSYWRRFTR